MNENTREWLDSLLADYNVPLAKWRKTPDDLLAEIDDGSCTLREQDGRLVRTVRVAVIYASSDGQHYWATRRRRKPNSEYALTEKLHIGESVIEGAKRGLREETGIAADESISTVHLSDFRKTETGAHSYPGLTNQYEYEVAAISLRTERTSPYNYTEPDGKQNVVKLCVSSELGGPHGKFASKMDAIREAILESTR